MELQCWKKAAWATGAANQNSKWILFFSRRVMVKVNFTKLNLNNNDLRTVNEE